MVLRFDNQYRRAITVEKLSPESSRSMSTETDDCFGFASVQIQGQTSIAEQGMNGSQDLFDQAEGDVVAKGLATSSTHAIGGV